MRRLFAVLVLSTIAACNGPPCRSPSDCAFGTYCVLDVGTLPPRGECVRDCLEHTDCPDTESNLTQAICDNIGRCRIEGRPPRLLISEPEIDTVYDEGTRRIRISGEVETAALTVSVAVRISQPVCSGAPPRTISLTNPNPGTFSTIPFVVDGLVVDPGASTVTVTAATLGSTKTRRIPIVVACPDCVEIRVQEPASQVVRPGLELERISGVVAGDVRAVVWRIYGRSGDVLDGIIPVVDGRFVAERIPLFAGTNRLEIVAAENGGSESRCSVSVGSSVGSESGVRALISWDGPTSDLDLHIVGPGGSFGDPMSALSARSRRPTFGGDVLDDAEGFGPEVLTIDDPPAGTYGFIVEPVADVDDPGATVTLRILYDGRLVQRAPIGPAHLSSDLGLLWVAGQLEVADDAATWVGHEQLVPAMPLPDAPPERWPPYRN